VSRKNAGRQETGLERAESSVEPTMRVRQPDGEQIDAVRTDGETEHLQLREERLRIEKVPEEVGKVRIGKRVTEWTETVEVPLRREDLVLEVLPGSGVVRIEGRELHAGDVFELALVQERATVVKETVLSEDVYVRKTSADVQETVQETLRREELVVDEDGDFDVVEGDAGVELERAPQRR
jgi:uncharacterized protein (TIGR02271 family)